jgi:hypothetical protein
MPRQFLTGPALRIRLVPMPVAPPSPADLERGCRPAEGQTEWDGAELEQKGRCRRRTCTFAGSGGIETSHLLPVTVDDEDTRHVLPVMAWSEGQDRAI